MNKTSASAAVLVTGQGGSEMVGKWRQALRERRERRRLKRAFQRRAMVDQEAVPQRLAKLLLFGRQVIFLPTEEARERPEPAKEGS